MRLYEYVAQLGQIWNTSNNLGLVVGATQPNSLAQVRYAAPDLWILAPGVGAQGGELGAALRAGLRADGLGMLIPVSRGISRAADPRQAALELRDRIYEERQVIAREFSRNRKTDSGLPSKDLRALAVGLLDAGCIQFGSFTLKSGIISPIYIDLRRLSTYPNLLSSVAEAFIKSPPGFEV